MIEDFQNAMRLIRVGRILARHDALFILKEMGMPTGIQWLAKFGSIRRNRKGRKGQRLSRALQEAGPSFIKLGQALSTRSDLFGEEMCDDLSHLQDQIPPFTARLAREAIVKELGQPIEDLYSEFDDTPVAAASIAQVHFAVTNDGEEVAVKVLRPNIEHAFQRDLNLFRWAARMIERTVPGMRRLRPVQSVEILAETIQMEMDLRFEAAAASELAENFQGDPTFYVPAVFLQHSGRRVLTIERINAIPLDDRKAIIEAGLNPVDVLEKAANAFFNQVFRDGFFHADLHPGNLFVDRNGIINVVDFGIMGRLTLKDRRFLGELLIGFLRRDYRSVAEVHFRAGWVPAHKSVDSFTQAARAIAEPILDKPQNEVSIGRLLGLLFHITQTFDMEAQPQLLLLQKTMLVSEGTARKLAPEANMWMISRPLIEAWMIKNLGPQARVKVGVDTVIETLERLPSVIENLEKGAAMIASGQLKLDPKTVRALRGDNGPIRITPYIWAALAAGLILLAHLV
ncbi:MAG: 2-polyprenylphenol 6-hydroxylase [Rhodospirillales bacterium]|jgi:ubiquinone biosynthesis protein|nr:2-polyprenylphenol 6-hydroxylase [Rhodospirillales bacterium]